MTRDEIVTVLRCGAEKAGCNECPIGLDDPDCIEKMTRPAADLIENQQRHIEAGWCYRRARYDEEYRMPPDGFCSYGKRKDGGAGE